MEKIAQEKRKGVALLIETSNSYARGLLRGIRDYEKVNKSWSIFLSEHSRGNPDPYWLRNWKGDGIIARIENEIVASAIKISGLPVVDVSASRKIPNLLWVETNDKAIAELAAEHLVHCGLKNFAYCGDPYFNWSKWRNQHFKKTLNNFGFNCYEYQLNCHGINKLGWLEELKRLSRWLISLPKPIGIMACYDICGQQIIETCKNINLAVPDEVSVIGVDNDELLCELSDPPLSSIIPNAHYTGYKAAELLDRLMNGEKISKTKYLIDPIGISPRQSTDILKVEDKYIADALKFINENIEKDIKIKDILSNIPLSRRVFERRFFKIFKRSPYEEIMRLKLLKVKQLLVETDLPIYLIAKKTGFNYLEYMSSLFKKKFGIPPSHYRVKNRYHKYPASTE